eukprot:g26800.t1
MLAVEDMSRVKRNAPVTINLVEGCAGGATGCYLMKQICEHLKTKFNVRINVSSTALEKDEMKKRFITQNHGDVTHLMDDIACGVTGGYCHQHQKQCHLGLGSEDWLIESCRESGEGLASSVISFSVSC